MFRKKNYILLTFMLLCALPVVLSAGGTQEAAPAQENSVVDKSSSAPLSIGLLPDADSIPFLVAEKEGIFQEENVEVELITFQNPVERDAAFQAGQVDGIIADSLGAIFTVVGGGDGVITSVTNGRYGLAAAPSTKIERVDELAGKEIGISSNTIIEYVASRLLAQAGVPSEKFNPKAVPKIPVRMELLLSGKLTAACLPEPLYSLALARGAEALADSTSLGVAPGVMLFTNTAATQREESMARFYRAYWRAAQRINADPDAYRDFLVEEMGFPEVVKESFSFVEYEYPRLPTPEELGQVADWMLKRDLIKTAPNYEDLCAPGVLRHFEELDGESR